MLKKVFVVLVSLAILAGCTACAPVEDGDVVNGTTDAGSSVETVEIYEFTKSYKYPSLQDTAFQFFKAYIQGDISTASSLMDSADNSCLAYFSTNKGSLDSVTDYSVELVNYQHYEKNGEQTETAQLNIRYSLEDNETVIYMCLSMDHLDIVNEDGSVYKKWKVTNFDFEA